MTHGALSLQGVGFHLQAQRPPPGNIRTYPPEGISRCDGTHRDPRPAASIHLDLLPGRLGLGEGEHLDISFGKIALPLLVYFAYFAVMWFGTFALGKAIGLPYDRTTALAFTAAGNDFEPAIAVAIAIATFGVTSGQALSGVVGPLIEVPVLIALVYVSLAWRKRFTTPA